MKSLNEILYVYLRWSGFLTFPLKEFIWLILETPAPYFFFPDK